MSLVRKEVLGWKVVAADIHGDGEWRGWFDKQQMPGLFLNEKMVFNYVDWCLHRNIHPAKSPTTLKLFCNG